MGRRKAEAAAAADGGQHWVRFARDHDWPLSDVSLIAYLAGQEVELRHDTVVALEREGAAERIPAPSAWEAHCIRANRNFRPSPMPQQPKGWTAED